MILGILGVALFWWGFCRDKEDESEYADYEYGEW